MTTDKEHIAQIIQNLQDSLKIIHDRESKTVPPTQSVQTTETPQKRVQTTVSMTEITNAEI